MSHHLSSYQREQIASLYEVAKNMSEFVRTMEPEGRKTSRATVSSGYFGGKQDVVCRMSIVLGGSRRLQLK